MTVTALPSAASIGAGQLVHVDPGTLLLERNIRETTLDADFVASIKDVGVLEPIVAVTNDDGGLVVRFGHRRALAAVEAGRATVPVYVAGSDDLADTAEVDRIVRQHDENTQRKALTAGEQVGVVEQLAAFGISAAQITKRTRLPRKHVDAALTVAQSQLASKAAARYESLTLEQAAAVAEFEDEPETAKALIVAAVDQPESFAHIVQRERDDRDDRAAHADVVASIEKHGVKYVEDLDWRRSLHYLKVSAGGALLTKVNHAKCPGHVATVEQRGWTKDNRPKYEVVYGCTDPEKHRHFNTLTSGSTSFGKKPAAEMSDEEREKAREQRALVIGNNKAWASAKKVRRAWLAEFAAAKTAPKGTAAFIVHALCTNTHALSDYNSSTLAVEWLNVKHSGTQTNKGGIKAAAADATDGRALQIALVQVLSSYECQLADDAWRTDGKTSNAGAYLRFLESIGYGLSDVEQYAVSSKTA